MLLHELGHPGGLLGDEGVQRHLAGLDHIERLLPDGGHAGIGNGGRHSVDEREGRIRRADGAALPQQVAAIEQARDRAAQNNGLLESRPAKVVAPSQETINQLQQLNSQKYPDNANGLGRTAIQSYGQYANSQAAESLSSKVQVDISV